MGAVLVALLAAALFVGAGAAGTTYVKGQTVFFYEDLDDTDFAGTWSYGAYSFTIPTSGKGFVADTSLPEGKYTQGDEYVYLKKATVTITAEATTKPAPGITYIVGNNGVAYVGDALTFNPVSPNKIPASWYLVTKPNGVAVNTSDLDNFDFTTPGQYKIQAIFDQASGFVSGTPSDALVTGVAFTFTVAKANEVTVSADKETVTIQEPFSITITGKPGLDLTVTPNNVGIVSFGSIDGDTTTGEFTMPNTGKAIIYLSALTETGSGKVVVTGTDISETLTIKIIDGAITAATEKDSYYIGTPVKLTGTTTVNVDLYAYIAGTNIPITLLGDTNSYKIPVNNGEWELSVKATTIQGMKLDAGTYTVYISTNPDKDTIKTVGTYTTVSLILKQPFISITDAPAVAVQGAKYTVTGTAEAATTAGVKFYLFGTNYFSQSPATVPVEDDGTFEIELTASATNAMDAGQYFMVVQHPMYDEQYNIQINNYSTPLTAAHPGDVVLFDSNGKQISTKPLFTVYDRQKTNAAQALCDELDSQNIDDMYVKLSFVVAAPTSVINPIPSEITQGSKLTVSGQTNLGEGEMVTVEMVATAFAAQPKETVGSASFIALTTKTNADGTWEITFDTTGLNVDEYTITAAVEGIQNKATAKINVIEGAPTENPTEQPTQTEQPTEQPTQTEAPATPGFGALAALAGLGAVAVLLLRRE